MKYLYYIGPIGIFFIGLMLKDCYDNQITGTASCAEACAKGQQHMVRFNLVSGCECGKQ